MSAERHSPDWRPETADSLESRIREAIDSANPTAAALAESKSKGGQTPLIAVATYCDGQGFLRDYKPYMDVIERSGRFFIQMNLFDALKDLYLSTNGTCSRRRLKNVSKKYRNQHKKLPSYSDGDITIVRAKSKGRLSDALYYRRVFYEEGKHDIYFPLKGEALSECFKQAKQIRTAYDQMGFSLMDLLRKFHPKSKLLKKLAKIQSVRVDELTLPRTSNERLSLKAAIESYLKTKEERRPKTYLQAQSILARFEKFIGGNKFLDEITKEEARKYLTKIPPAKSYNHHYRAVNGLFRWAIHEEHLNANPCAKMKLKKVEHEEVKVLSNLECIALLLAAEELFDGELLPYVVLIVFCAVRPDSEARNIKWSDINFEDEEIRIRQGKVPDPRSIDAPKNAILWLKRCDQSRPIYPSSYNVFKRKWAAVRRAAGFRGGTWLPKARKAEELLRKPWVQDYGRHTAISCRVRQTGDIYKTATWAGTSPKVIKKNYLKIVPSSQAEEFWSLEP